MQSCEEIARGGLHDQFIVDVIQGGAGTSSNMNANEVIANRALEILGCRKGDYGTLNPNDHVNLNQSTNDVYPTALRLALLEEIHALRAALESLKIEFSRKAEEFKNIVKVGRTQLQDAVPMTLGQEFSAYAVTINTEIIALAAAAEPLKTISLGGTATEPGINADSRYAHLVCRHLSMLAGESLLTATDLIEATQDTSVFVQLSSAAKRVAIKVSKIANDLRLLSSGPRAGLSEIFLPAMQAGSSIMPGKVKSRYSGGGKPDCF